MEKLKMKIPFMPEKKAAVVVIDGRTPGKIVNNLVQMGIDIIKTPRCEALYEAIACHPDILLHPVNGTDIVVAPNVYEKMKPLLLGIGLNPVMGCTQLKRNYPDNVAYNVARVGNIAIHNLKYTDQMVRELLERENVTCIHANQGYSKCSICIVSEKAIITEDKGIGKIAEKWGIETLMITPGYIDLQGLAYGFIGGASGVIDEDKIGFCGSLERHPDYRRIAAFLEKWNKTPVYLYEGNPVDIGSIIPLLEMAY
ncbi:MAG: DUF6873 family GME fold protein [Bacillota bacterium]